MHLAEKHMWMREIGALKAHDMPRITQREIVEERPRYQPQLPVWASRSAEPSITYQPAPLLVRLVKHPFSLSPANMNRCDWRVAPPVFFLDREMAPAKMERIPDRLSFSQLVADKRVRDARVRYRRSDDAV